MIWIKRARKYPPKMVGPHVRSGNIIKAPSMLDFLLPTPPPTHGVATSRATGEPRFAARLRLQKPIKFWSDCEANVAVEFAIVGPLFIALLLAILGVGIDGFFQLVLDDAVRAAARQVQILGPASANGGAFATAVCNELGIVTTPARCTSNLTYNMQTNTPPANFADLQPIAMPPNGQLPNVFPAVTGNSQVLIQVAYPLPMYVPFVSAAMTLNGTNSILATTTVFTEPHT